MFLPTNKELIDKNSSFENGAHNLSKDSFTFLVQIGTGSFGKVYKVSSKLTNQVYALKVLSKNQITNLRLTEQLKNEISILSRCNHENIMKLFSVFEDSGYIYLITEMANESSLFSLLTRSNKFDEKMVAKFMNDIIQAIIYLHSQKPVIIHRDIKPENILVHNSRCKIADFGWSNNNDDFRNTYCGTPDYLAPEMINGTGHNEKLDIWTLGILMFELLHGRPPFTPKDKNFDVRSKQKQVEKNILSGNMEFDSSVSIEARQAIISMSNPNSQSRPNAKDILDMDFFRKNLSSPNKNNFESNNNGNHSFVKNTETELIIVRTKLREIEMKNDALLVANKSLNELLESKEAKWRVITNELEELKVKNNKLKEDFENELKNRNIIGQDSPNNKYMSNAHSFDNNINKQNTNEHFQKIIDSLQAEVIRCRYEFEKSMETTKTIFDKTKGISIRISDFHMKHIATTDLDQTQDFVLSFDNTVGKLEAIFDDYNRLKKSVPPKQGILMVGQKDPIQNRIVIRSKSPARIYQTNLDTGKGFPLKNKINLNGNNFKEISTPQSFRKQQ